MPPLITFDFDMDFPYTVRETLHILPDGQVWYWSCGASDSRLRNRVGTFHYAMESARLSGWLQLAEDIQNLPPYQLNTARGVPRMTVHVGEHAFAHYPGGGGPTPLQAAYGHVLQVLSRVEESPLSVIQMSIRAQQTALPNHGSTNALFQFENIGTRPVVFMLRPETFGLMGITGTSKTFGWQNTDGNIMGLIKGMGELVDGIYTPAEMAPGEKATVAFLNVVQPAQARTALSGGVEGTIAFVRSEGQLDPFPEQPIWIAANAGEITMGT